MNKLLTIRQAAELLGVSTKTIRRWEQEGKMKATRTVGGHRRFKISELLGSQKETQLTIAYVRGSQNKSPEQLNQQVSTIQAYCVQNNWNYQIIKDIVSGANRSNPELIRLLKLICSQQVNRLVLNSKNQLLTITGNLVFTLCEIFGIEVILLNQTGATIEEEELADETKEIIHSFNHLVYSSHLRQRSDLLQQLQEVARKL
ncbi:MAG TPA: IS607 family transposase [Cyanothece sp. UBA12306]|nr:IS607 family transposase [Cyanothece sp. UBA12306]